MITEVKLTNFKAFGDGPSEESRTAPMSKITLIYGPNSAGKSSLVQSVLLLKQSVEERHGPAQLAASGRYCDLGNFNSLVHHHAVDDRHISIALRYRTPFECMSEFDICGDHQNQLRLKRYMHKRARVGGADFEIDLTAVDRRDEQPQFKITDGSSDGLAIENLTRFISDRRGRLIRYGLISDEDQSLFGDLIRHMVFIPRINNLIPTQLPTAPDTYALGNLIQEKDEQINVLSAEIDNYSSRRTQVRLEKEAELSRLNRSLNYLRTRQARAGCARIEEAISLAMRDASNDIVEELLSKIAYLGPVRNAPQRVYRDSGVRRQVGISAEHIYSVLSMNEYLVGRINQYFKDFYIPYKLTINSGAINPHLGANVGIIGLQGTRTKTMHSLVDVGFGISQILPTIIEGIAGESSIICVDEPEVHMHPRLQAYVADFLIDTAVDSENPKQWIVETHSELLARRIQTRIAEGKITPEDVSVLYIDPKEDHSEIINLELGADGEWLTEWPHGFFDDGASEIITRYQVGE